MKDTPLLAVQVAEGKTSTGRKVPSGPQDRGSRGTWLRDAAHIIPFGKSTPFVLHYRGLGRVNHSSVFAV